MHKEINYKILQTNNPFQSIPIFTFKLPLFISFHLNLPFPTSRLPSSLIIIMIIIIITVLFSHPSLLASTFKNPSFLSIKVNGCRTFFHSQSGYVYNNCHEFAKICVSPFRFLSLPFIPKYISTCQIQSTMNTKISTNKYMRETKKIYTSMQKMNEQNKNK